MKDRRAKQRKLRGRHLNSDRQRRIDLLIEMGLIGTAEEIPEDAIPVDPNRTAVLLRSHQGFEIQASEAVFEVQEGASGEE